MYSCIGTEGSKGSLFTNGVVPMGFRLGTEGSKSSLLRNCFSVKELKVPVVPFLEMGVSHIFLFRN